MDCPCDPKLTPPYPRPPPTVPRPLNLAHADMANFVHYNDKQQEMLHKQSFLLTLTHTRSHECIVSNYVR